MYRFVVVAAWVLLSFGYSHGAYLTDLHRRLDWGWRFSLDADSTALAPGYDDSSWRRVDLPHDWSVECDFGYNPGCTPAAVGWYRRDFDYDPWDECDRMLLYFEGVYMNSEVWVNGHYAGGHLGGCAPFYVDMAPYLKPGSGNVIAVKIDNSALGDRSPHSGAGICRSVYYAEAPRVEIIPWSMEVTTPMVTPDSACVNVRFLVENRTDTVASLNMNLNSFVPDGKSIPIKTEFTAAPHDTTEINMSFMVDDPAIWSPDSPASCFLMARLYQGNDRIDTEILRYLIKRLEYVDGAVKLNGEPIRLVGACVDHTNGMIGALGYRDAEIHKARLLKNAGFNAVCMSDFNPPSPAFMDACCVHGLIVVDGVDETFDRWSQSEIVPFDYAESDTLKSSGEPAAIRITVDREGIGSGDLAYALVEIVDSDGNLVSNADNHLMFEINHPGSIFAVGNMDLPDCHVYNNSSCDARNGRALCVLRSTLSDGDFELRVTSPGLPAATVTLKRIIRII